MMFKEKVLLSAYSNYRIGGPARYFFIAKNLGQLETAVKEARERSIPVFILGGGTNLLIPDSGFPGLVLKPDLRELAREKNSIRAGAGILISDLLKFALKERLSGLEWAGGLPGTLGGAIRGNAGAFGGEIKDCIVSVLSLDTATGKTIVRKGKECRFKYRSSVFKEKKGREIILSAVLALAPGDPVRIRAGMREKIAYRKAKHPLEYPNIGSIFKNVPVTEIPRSRKKELVHNVKLDPIPVIPTARLLSAAGLKGRARGGAMISLKHPNYIVNAGGAREKDVIALMELVKRTVKKKFGVELHEEVERLRDRVAELPKK